MSTIRELSQSSTRSLPSLRGVLRFPTALMARIVRTAGIWYRRHQQRRALAALPEYLLKDIGISAADAWAESRKGFWEK